MNIHCQICEKKIWEHKEKVDKKVICVCHTCWWHLQQKANSNNKGK